MSTEDFVNYFTHKYLVDISRSKWNLMPEKKRPTFIKILSNTKFTALPIRLPSPGLLKLCVNQK